MKPFTLRIPVRFTHTDPASYVFFPRYFEMLQAVVEDWITFALGFRYADLITVERIGLPTARTQCDFLRPSRLGEYVDITLYLEAFGRSSINIYFVGEVNGERRLEARSILVTTDLDNGRPKPIPDDLRAQLEAYRARQGDLPPSQKTH